MSILRCWIWGLGLQGCCVGREGEGRELGGVWVERRKWDVKIYVQSYVKSYFEPIVPQ